MNTLTGPRIWRAAPALIVLAVVLSYVGVATCGFVWDDDDYVVLNPVLRTWQGLWRIWSEPTSLPQYYPLVHTSFWLEYRLWGLRAPGYHLVNVALHAGSALLLWRLGQRLGFRGALLAASWFAVSPVHVESVAWITERKNVLSLLCYLLAAGRWLTWHDAGRRRDFAIGTLWFVCALWSKTVTASLPAVLLLVVWWRDGGLSRRTWRGASPWLVLGAVLGWWTVHLESTHVGAGAQPWQLAGAERLLVAGRAPWFYAVSLLWPFDTCFNYPRWQLDAGAPLQWLAPAAVVICVGAAWLLRGRIGRGPFAALCAFGGVLVPALGFFDVFPFRYSFVADHFQYHASLALLVGMSALASAAAARWLPAKVAVGAAVVWIVVQGATTAVVVRRYQDFPTLWRATLATNPDSSLALVNLGGMSGPGGDAAAREQFHGQWPPQPTNLDEARRLLRRCLEVDPTSHEARINLGIVEQTAGNLAEAKRLYEAALQYKPNDPSARNNLAVLAIEERRFGDAIVLAEEAIALVPGYVDAHKALSRALVETRQWRRARQELELLVARGAADRDTELRLVDCLLGLGEVRQAAGLALHLLVASPQEPRLRAVAARALAKVLRDVPVAEIRAAANNACRNAGVDAAPLLPLLAEELRADGRSERAEALLGR